MKYHIITFGCQMNLSDSERVAAVLESIRYKQTPNINEADLVVVNMCSVRQSAVDRVFGMIEKFKTLRQNKPKLKTILTGCILKQDRKKFEKSFDYVLGTTEIQKLKNILSHKIDDRQFYETTSKECVYVPIMNGCNNFCSYCVVPYTRGREVSYPVKDIIKETERAIRRGVKKIWLLGQNVNSYNYHIRANKTVKFPELLKLVNDIPGNFELNFLTSHPKDFSDELIKTMLNCEKLSKDLNLPLQSGDDQILKKMNRPYTVSQYKKLVKKIRRVIPNIRLSTDIIVGFPGETKKQFENTEKVIKEIGYGVAFINKYSPRAGTAAAKLKDNVPWAEKKRREKILIKLVNEK